MVNAENPYGLLLLMLFADIGDLNPNVDLSWSIKDKLGTTEEVCIILRRYNMRGLSVFSDFRIF